MARHIGEQNHWAKCTNFENGLHVPLLWVLPPSVTSPPPLPAGAAAAASAALNAVAVAVAVAPRSLPDVAETVSIFPTLVDLAGLPALPGCPPNSTLSKV